MNALVAPTVAETPSPWAGVWIAEDIDQIVAGVRDRSWVEGTLGVVGGGLDALAMVSDPVGALLQYGIAWLIEHVKPLSEALDWLAGDPAAIAAHAQTWRNVAASLAAEAEELDRAVRWDTTEWTGAAGDAYRGWAARRGQTVTTLGQAADGMALMTEGAGLLIGTVRLMVRDAVATVVSRLIVYAGELTASLGSLTALVAEQVTTLCASWGAKIARWLRDLLASIRRMMNAAEELSRRIRALIGRRGEDADEPSTRETPEPTKEPTDPKAEAEAEAERRHALGTDPAQKKYRPGEEETAVRIEAELGIQLRRGAVGDGWDWVGSDGLTYDAVGNFDPRFFPRQWPNLQRRILDHQYKADRVPVDVARFTPDQKRLVREFVEEHALAPRVFILGE